MDQATALRRLQDVDLELRRAQKQLDEMPEKRTILQDRRKIAEVEQLRGRAEQVAKHHRQGMQRLEDESTQLTEKIDSEQKRVMSGELTTPKEIQHMTREIESLKRRKEKIEIDLLALMERVEKADGQILKVDKALEQLAKQEKIHVGEFTEIGGSLQSDIKALKADRKKVAADLPAELLGRYESLAEAKSGLGVGVLIDNACTACRMELPAEEVAALLEGDDVAVCPVCHRLLITCVEVTEGL